MRLKKKSARKVAYADKQEIEEEIIRRYMCCMEEPEDTPVEMARTGGMQQTPLTDTMKKKDAADLTDGRLGGRVTRKEIYETELPHRAVAVYLYLETRADRERTCYPAIGTIARELHLSVSTVKRAIHDLECAGFIQKSRDGVRTEEKSSLLYEIIK